MNVRGGHTPGRDVGDISCPPRTFIIHYRLQLLLFVQYGDALIAQRRFTMFTHVKTFFAVMELAYLKVKVAQTTACSILLACCLAVLLEKIVQGLQHALEIEASMSATFKTGHT